METAGTFRFSHYTRFDLKWLLNLLLLRFCYRKTRFQHLNRLLHIFFGLKSQFLSHENENVSPWQRNYLIKTLQQLFSHVSHYCPVPPQLACVSEMALLRMIAWFWWVFSSLCPLSTDLIPLKIGKLSYCGFRNLWWWCVMCIPWFPLLMQKKPDISFTIRRGTWVRCSFWLRFQFPARKILFLHLWKW